jgi:transposase
MEVLYERCFALDVHKSSIAECILRNQRHKSQKHLRLFGCTTRDLLELVVRHAAMESTGVYWNPLWNVLEEHFQMVLANAQRVHPVFHPLAIVVGIALIVLSYKMPKRDGRL